METLVEPVRLAVESFLVTKLDGQPQIYQGHRLNNVKGEYRREEVDFPTGTLVVPLANVAGYLLEPESNDGLLVWNYFNRYLAQQWSRDPLVYPVYKLYDPISLVKDTLPEER